VHAQWAQVNLNLAQNGVVLELRRTAANQNCYSCQFADKQAEGATTTKVMSFCE